MIFVLLIRLKNFCMLVFIVFLRTVGWISFRLRVDWCDCILNLSFLYFRIMRSCWSIFLCIFNHRTNLFILILVKNICCDPNWNKSYAQNNQNNFQNWEIFAQITISKTLSNSSSLLNFQNNLSSFGCLYSCWLS